MITFDKANVTGYADYIRDHCLKADVVTQRIGISNYYVIRVDGFTIFDTSELHAFVSGYKAGYAKGKVYR